MKTNEQTAHTMRSEFTSSLECGLLNKLKDLRTELRYAQNDQIKSELLVKIGDSCRRVGDLHNARRFYNLATFYNPLEEESYRKRTRLSAKEHIPTRTFEVVISTYNRCTELKKCVDTIRNNTFFPVKILVVCDRCNDGTQDYIEAERAKEDFIGVINENHLGSVLSLKLGLYLADGDYIASLSDDVQVMPGWDLEVVKAIDGLPNAGCAAPLVLNTDGTIQSVGQHNPYLSHKYNWIGKIPSFDHGAAVGGSIADFSVFQKERPCDYGYFPVLKRECLHKIGYIDDNYRNYCVDTDIGYAVQLHGWQTMYCPTSVFIHHSKSIDEIGQRTIWEKASADIRYFNKKWGIYRS